jgi:outer membrane protein assembly factor BamB
MKVQGFFILPFLLSFSTVAANLIYFSDSPHGIYNFDTTTGTSTLRAGVSGTQRFFGMDARPTDGTVFAVNYDDSNSGLYTININTGAFSLIGMTGISGMVGVAFNPLNGQLFGLRNGGGLYSINQLNGAASLIGNTGLVDRGLAFSPSGHLFGFTEDGKLYGINPATGSTSAVGGSGNPVPPSLIAEDAAFDSTGTLYASDFYGHIFRTDPLTGNGVLIGSAGYDVLGLLVIPEPNTAFLSVVGTVMLLLFRRTSQPAA